MNGVMLNPKVGEYMDRVHRLRARVVREDGDYERVVTLSVATDRDRGTYEIVLSIDEVGDGPGMAPDVLGTYPMSHGPESLIDARRVARHYGLPMRRATTHSGWLAVPLDADETHDEWLRFATRF